MPDLPERGQWVKVWGKVMNPEPHPEEHEVRLESHNEHYICLVRRDRVEVVDRLPEFAAICTSLLQANAPNRGVWLTRCMRVDEHQGEHRDHEGRRWTDSNAYGNVEERP